MTNYTVKLILWKHNPNEKGLLPIYLQITIERKTSYLSTGHYVNQKAWDGKNQQLRESHPLAKEINPELAFRKSQVVKKIIEMQVGGKDVSAKVLKSIFTSKDVTNIFNFVDQYCEEMKHKRSESRIGIYERHKRKLLEFTGSSNLNFEDINNEFLYKFENFLRDQGKKDKTDLEKQHRGNYVATIFSTLRTWFNAARKRGIIKNYPFATYENPTQNSPGKDYLDLSELQQWERFADETTNNILKQSAVYFLFGCYSGLRISEWYKFDINKHVVNGNIKMKAEKNDEQIVVPINNNKPLARTLGRIHATPLTTPSEVLNRKLKVIAGKLDINKSISSHCARKTFAVTMCADRGISSETCAKLMAITVKVCVESYYVVTAEKIKDETSKAWRELD